MAAKMMTIVLDDGRTIKVDVNEFFKRNPGAAAKAARMAEEEGLHATRKNLAEAASKLIKECVSKVEALKELLQSNATITSKYGLVGGKIAHDLIVSFKGEGRAGAGRPAGGRKHTEDDFVFLAQLIDKGKTGKDVQAAFNERKKTTEYDSDTAIKNLMWAAVGKQARGGSARQWIRDNWLDWKPGDPIPFRQVSDDE